MIPIFKFTANLFEGEIGHFPDQVHGHLAGEGRILGPPLSPQSAVVDVVEVAHLFDDDVGGGHDVGGVFEHIPYRTGDSGGVDIASLQIPQGHDLVDGPFDLSDIGGDVLSHILQDRLGQLHPHTDGFVFDDGHARFIVGGLDVRQ